VAEFAVSTAMVACSFGVAPVPLTTIPLGPIVQIGAQLAGTIQDFQPMANVATFGMCTAPTNPQVMAATAAALGVLTPQPCIPMTTAPWVPGQPLVLINNQPALTASCTLMCQWLGVITINSPGQTGAGPVTTSG